VLAFESPRRLLATLTMLSALDPERPVVVCRELTKLHEEIARGSAEELAARYEKRPPRGEVVLLVGAAKRSGVDGAPVPGG
jgi:16S rRNA (cytidine1402-2'-O)-methyltransferase